MHRKPQPHFLFIFFLFLTAEQASAELLSVNVSNPDGSATDSLVVFTKPVDFSPPARIAKKIEVSQQDRAFNPYMTVIQLQDEVAFTNLDDFTHHIYSISENNHFSFKLQSNDSHHLIPKLSKHGVSQIAMGCNIHDWMSGYILVVDTPYFGKTNSTGNIILELDQPGRYEVTLWHPQLDTKTRLLSQEVDVQKDVTLEWKLPTQLKVELPEVDEEAFDFLEKY
ncbi:MAG: hypothetical protein ACRBB6_09800 [Neptuniibacter sp.]